MILNRTIRSVEVKKCIVVLNNFDFSLFETNKCKISIH